MTQKIIKVGNSAAIVIPKEYISELRLKVGQPIQVDFDREEQIFRVDLKPKKNKKVQSSTNYKLSPEFLKWANEFVDKNIDLFKALARRNEISHN